MTIQIKYDSEDGGLQTENTLDTFESAIEYLEGLKRQIEDEARRAANRIPDEEEPMGEREARQVESQSHIH